MDTFSLTITVEWGPVQNRSIETDMNFRCECVDPDDSTQWFTLDFDPSSLTLDESNSYSNTINVTVSVKKTAPEGNYTCKALADPDDGGTPDEPADDVNEGNGCQVRIIVSGDGNGDGDGVGRCFIATAAYGTSTAAELDTLRAFRDEVLMQSTIGSQFVALYYQTSPPIADFIAGHEALRTLVRELVVDPVVWVVEATTALWRN